MEDAYVSAALDSLLENGGAATAVFLAPPSLRKILIAQHKDTDPALFCLTSEMGQAFDLADALFRLDRLASAVGRLRSRLLAMPLPDLLAENEADDFPLLGIIDAQAEQG